MSSLTSENSEIDDNRVQNTLDKYKESGSDDTVRKAVSLVTEKYNKKKLSEISEISAPSLSSISSDASNSDTDCNSDLDEIKHKDEEKLQEIEIDFHIFNELFYKQRLMEIENKLIEIESDSGKDYSIPLQQLKDQLKTQLEVSSVLKEFKLTNIEHKYAAGEQGINQNFENNKEILYDTMKADLEKKLQQLGDDRIDADIDAILWTERQIKHSQQSSENVQPKPKPVVTSGPKIVYMLKDHEILDDWTTIKKLLLSSQRREDEERLNNIN